jgi:16S rRNA (cytosine1402-N4)-methyltransferase
MMKEDTNIQEFLHVSVLPDEVIEGLELKNKKVIVDCTLGLGGHAKLILQNLGDQGKLIGFEVDEDNLKAARKNLKSFGERAVLITANFSRLSEELKKLKVRGVDAVFIDLGLSSPQVDNPGKGFSFLREGPLDMRFDKTQALTAAQVINMYPQTELIRIFKEYGEEPLARKIVAAIAKRRKSRPFKTTTELAWFLEKLLKRKSHIHPATRVFQALRIAVNNELDVLDSVLRQAVEVLKKKGRLVVISYHSLEDRMVKRFFRECAREFVNEPEKLTTTYLKPVLKIITKKPVMPSQDEITRNPRSRSAKLRIAEKL